MGLRLANAFTEAGLPLPAIRTDLRTVQGLGSRGFAFFEGAIREVLPTLERCGIGADVDVDSFADRLERETSAVNGHAFLPLQVGAWARAAHAPTSGPSA